MAKPDLSTPEGTAAYRAELRAIAAPWRLAGLVMVMLAMALIFWARTHEMPVFASPLGLAGVALMIAGWAILFWIIAKRSAHHRRRMAED